MQYTRLFCIVKGRLGGLYNDWVSTKRVACAHVLMLRKLPFSVCVRFPDVLKLPLGLNVDL